MTTSAIVESESTPSMPEKSSSSRHIICALLSAAIPGLGQLIKGHPRKAALFLAATCVLVSLEWILRLPFSGMYASLAVLLSVTLALIASCDAFITRSGVHAYAPSRWFLLLVIPAAMVICQFAVGGLWRVQGVRAFAVTSSSMEPTLAKGEHIVVDAGYYKKRSPVRGDVIVYRRQNTLILKRVIAIAGDKIEGTREGIILNGTLLSEPYAQDLSNGTEVFTFPKTTILPGQLFVAGDNRAFSFDSRLPQHGPINVSDVTGKALYIYRSNSTRRFGMAIE